MRKLDSVAGAGLRMPVPGCGVTLGCSVGTGVRCDEEGWRLRMASASEGRRNGDQAGATGAQERLGDGSAMRYEKRYAREGGVRPNRENG